MKTGVFPARHLLITAGVIIAVAAIIVFVYTSAVTVATPQMTPANAVNIIKAARALTHDLRAAGKPIPVSVGLSNLVAAKYLAASDAAAFDGLDTTLYLLAPNSPQAVLLRVRMTDGSQTVLLADGTSRTIPAGSKE